MQGCAQAVTQLLVACMEAGAACTRGQAGRACTAQERKTQGFEHVTTGVWLGGTSPQDQQLKKRKKKQESKERRNKNQQRTSGARTALACAPQVHPWSARQHRGEQARRT